MHFRYNFSWLLHLIKGQKNETNYKMNYEKCFHQKLISEMENFYDVFFSREPIQQTYILWTPKWRSMINQMLQFVHNFLQTRQISILCDMFFFLMLPLPVRNTSFLFLMLPNTNKRCLTIHLNIGWVNWIALKISSSLL